MTTEESKKENQKIIAKINAVEGFTPEAEMTEFQYTDEDGNKITKKMLRLAAKQTWFYLKYPEGVIRNEIIHSDDKYVKACSSLYASRNDPDENYIRREFAVIAVRPMDPFFEGKTPEEMIGLTENKAKAKAESTALHKAGFGLQLESDDEISGQVDDMLKADLIRSASLPQPPTRTAPDSAPVQKKRGRKSKAEKEQEEKELLKKTGKQIEFPTGEPILPPPRNEKKPVSNLADMNPGPLPEAEINMNQAARRTLESGNANTYDNAYEQALNYVPEAMGKSLREMNPSYIIWSSEHSEDVDERNFCKMIMQHDPKVKAALERQRSY